MNDLQAVSKTKRTSEILYLVAVALLVVGVGMHAYQQYKSARRWSGSHDDCNHK